MPKTIQSISIGDPDRTNFSNTYNGQSIINSLRKEAQVKKKLGGSWEATLQFIAGTKPAVNETDALQRRKIVRFSYDDGSIAEWRINSTTRQTSGEQDVIVKCDPIWSDLSDNRIRKTLSNGHVMFNVPFYSMTVSEVLTEIFKSSYNCPSHFTLGSIDGSFADETISVLASNNSHLEILREISRVIDCEWELSYDSANDKWQVSFVPADQVGGGESEASSRPIEIGKAEGNREKLQRSAQKGDFFSHIVPVGGAQSETFGIQRAVWPLKSVSYDSTANQTTIELYHKPIVKKDLLAGGGFYFGDYGGAGVAEIIATSKPNIIVVSGDLSGLSGLAQFYEDNQGTELSYIADQDAVDQIGVSELAYRREDITPYGNILENVRINPDFSSFTNGSPNGWQAVGGATLSQETTPENIQYGNSAVNISGGVDDGMETSIDIDLKPTESSPYFSLWIAGKTISGSWKVELIDSNGTAHPLANEASSNSAMTTGIQIAGIEPSAGIAKIKITLLEAGSEVIFDACTLTQSPDAYGYTDQMGARDLFIESARHLKREGGLLADHYTIDFYDQAYEEGSGALEVEVGSYVEVKDSYDPDSDSYGIDFIGRVMEIRYDESEAHGRRKKKVKVSRAGTRLTSFFDRRYQTREDAQSSPKIVQIERDPNKEVSGILDGIGSDISDLDDQLQTLSDNLDTLDGKLDTLETNLENNDFQLSTLGDSLNTLENNQDDLSSDLNTLDGNLGDLDDILGNPSSHQNFFESIATNEFWVDKFVANEGYMRKATIKDAYVEEIVGDQGFFNDLTTSNLWANTGTFNDVFLENITGNNAFFEQLVTSDLWADSATFNQAFVDVVTAGQIWTDSVVTNTIMSQNADIKGKLSVGTDQRVHIDPSSDTPPAGNIHDSGTESLTGISPSDEGTIDIISLNPNLIDFENFNVRITLSASNGRDSGPTYSGDVTIQGYDSTNGWEDLSRVTLTMSRRGSGESFDDVVKKTIDNIGTYNDFRIEVYHSHVYADDGIHGDDFSGSMTFEWEVYEQTFLLNNKGSYIRTSDTTYEKLGTTTSVVTSGAGGGITRWGDITDKPFDDIGAGLNVSSGSLRIHNNHIKDIISGDSNFQTVGKQDAVTFREVDVDEEIFMDKNQEISTAGSSNTTHRFYPHQTGHQSMGGEGGNHPYNEGMSLDSEFSVNIIDGNGDLLGWFDTKNPALYWPHKSEFGSVIVGNESEISGYGSGIEVNSGNLRVDASYIRGLLSAGGDLSYDNGTGQFSVTTYKSSDFDTDFGNKDTDNLSEGTNNKYFTDSRARGSISVSGSLGYDQATGVISYTERTDSEIRGLFSAGGDISYDNATGQFSVTTYKSSDFDTDFGNKTTDELSEGTENLYYTEARVKGVVSGSNPFQEVGVNADVQFGNIEITGTVNYKNEENLRVEDRIITINRNGTDTSADGAGITVERPSGNQTLKWTSTDGWVHGDDPFIMETDIFPNQGYQNLGVNADASFDSITVNGQNIFPSGGEQALGTGDDVQFNEGEFQTYKIVSRSVAGIDTTEDRNYWLLGEWGSSRINVFGKLTFSRSSGYDGLRVVEFGFSTSSSGSADHFKSYVEYTTGDDSYGDDEWGFARVTYDGTDYVALYREGGRYWHTTGNFTGHLINTPSVGRDDVFKTALTSSNVTLVSDITHRGTYKKFDVEFTEILGEAVLHDTLTGVDASFSDALSAETLRTDTGKFLSPNSYQFRNAGDSGYRDVQMAGLTATTVTASGLATLNAGFEADLLKGNTTENRFEVWDSTDEKVAMGYLEGLPKNDGSGTNWSSNDYGFWVKAGDRLTIDGDLEYVNGDWLIENDASMRIQESTNNNDIIRAGTHSGRKGVFLYDGNGMADSNILAELTMNGLKVVGDSGLETIVSGGYLNTSLIEADSITLSMVSFSPVESDSVIASINASSEGVNIEGDNIALDGNTSVAGTFSVVGENITLDGNTTIDGTFSVSGDTITLDGNTNIAGTFGVTGDTITLTGDTNIDGTFTVTGANITLDGYTTVSADFSVTGENITLDGDTTVNANFSVTGENITLDGDTTVNSNFSVVGENITLDGNTTIDGTFNVSGGNITLDGNTTVNGTTWLNGEVLVDGSVSVDKVDATEILADAGHFTSNIAFGDGATQKIGIDVGPNDEDGYFIGSDDYIFNNGLVSLGNGILTANSSQNQGGIAGANFDGNKMWSDINSKRTELNWNNQYLRFYNGLGDKLGVDMSNADDFSESLPLYAEHYPTGGTGFTGTYTSTSLDNLQADQNIMATVSVEPYEDSSGGGGGGGTGDPVNIWGEVYFEGYDGSSWVTISQRFYSFSMDTDPSITFNFTEYNDLPYTEVRLKVTNNGTDAVDTFGKSLKQFGSLVEVNRKGIRVGIDENTYFQAGKGLMEFAGGLNITKGLSLDGYVTLRGLTNGEVAVVDEDQFRTIYHTGNIDSASPNFNGLQVDGNTVYHQGNLDPIETGSDASLDTLSIDASTSYSDARLEIGSKAYQMPDGLWINSWNSDVPLTISSRYDTNEGVHFRRGSNAGGLAGQITWTGSSVNYGTGSDYRLKENDVILSETPAWIREINIRKFDWKRTGEKGIGVFAHELQQYRPQAVAGEKDAMYEDGEIKPQTVDYSMLVPDLIVTMQDALNRIDDLEQEVEQLKES